MNLPRPLSHSSISLYTECPQRYKIKYIDRVKEKPRHYFSFGISVHTALEYLYAAPSRPTIEQVLAHYEENWVAEGYKDAADEAKHKEQGRRILRGYFQKHASDNTVTHDVEYSFTTEVDGVPVTGKIDRIDETGDGRLAILDYKTGKALAAGRADTDAQLTMYQLVVERLLGMVARVSLYHLPTLNEQSSERHGQQLVDDVRRRIVSTAAGICAERFDPKPSEQVCKWCDYKPICPVFRRKP